MGGSDFKKQALRRHLPDVLFLNLTVIKHREEG